MTLVRVTVAGTIGKAVRINTAATIGAQIGVDFQLPDGTIPTLSELADALYIQSPPGEFVPDTGNPAGGHTVFESEIVDGLLLARVADPEIITGAYTFNTNVTMGNAVPINWKDSVGTKFEFLNFSTASGGGAAVGHIIKKVDTGVTTTSGTYANVTGAVVTFAEMDPNTDYAIFVRAYIGNSTSTTTPLNKFRVTKGGASVGGSEMFYESPGVTINSLGMLYYWSGVLNSGASGDLQLQHLSGNGTDTVFANDITIMMIKVDDLGAEIVSSTNSSLVELDDGNFPPAVFFATGSSVTIGDGTSDYLVFGSMRVQGFLTGGNKVTMRVNDGTITKLGQHGPRGDSSDELSLGFFQFWKAPSASTVLTLEAQGLGNPVDKIYSHMTAIRLNAFNDYTGSMIDTTTDLGNGPTDIITIAKTVAVTGSYGFIGGAQGPDSGAAGAPQLIRNNLNGGGDVTIAGNAVQRVVSNIVVGPNEAPQFAVSADQALSINDTIDADYHAPDATTPIIWTNAFLAIFEWTLANTDGFKVGNAGFVTDIRGTTVNVLAPLTATSYDGILAANLLDKIAAETISGNWTWEGRLVTDDSTTTRAGFNIPTGVAPTSPVQGDMWVTATDIFARLNGVDESLLFVNTENIIGDLEDTLDFFNGAAIDCPDVSVSSNGTVITFSIEKVGGGDVRHVFSDGVHTQDTTPPDTIALTAGTDTVPVLNFLYVSQVTKVLTVSTVGFPATEHVRLATVLCQSAASLQTDGAYKVHAWTDELFNSGISHLQDVNFWIRSQAASWISGALATPILGVTTFDVAISPGSVLQLHPHTYPAFDTSTGSEVMIVNDSVTAFKRVGDLTGELTDAAGGSLSNKFYNIVLWGAVSEDAVDSQLMVNLPTGSHNTAAAAKLDASETAVFSIPTDFIGVGFLIACLTVRHQAAGGGTFTLVENVDLRGLLPSISAAGVAGGGVSQLTELSDVDLTGELDNDILHRIAGIWVPSVGALTFDGTDFVCGGDVTGATIASIAAANLVDKITAETISGDWTFSGRVVTDDSTTTRAGFNIPEGVDPTTPVDGDIWVTTTDIFARINGVSESLKGLGGVSWTLETASFTLVASDRKNIEATVAATTATVPATIVAGDEFIIHNQTTSTKVVDIEPNTGHTIKGPGGDVVGGTDTLVLALGETVRLVAVSTSVLEIV